MSKTPPRPGEAYRTQPQDVVRAACPACHLEFDQPLAERTQRDVARAAEIQESARISQLAKRIKAAIDAQSPYRTEADKAALCDNLLDVLRNEGIWIP
ncbi:MAG: hypothetical protein V3V34_11830 [Kiloniellales bacterium]